MRILTMALTAGLAGLVAGHSGASAQSASGIQVAQAVPPDASPPRRRPVIRRVPIYPRRDYEPDVYPRYNPGPNAVRECTATYVQEYRPSGTVITPRMNCYWRRG